jgi:hypothetical protein
LVNAIISVSLRGDEAIDEHPLIGVPTSGGDLPLLVGQQAGLPLVEKEALVAIQQVVQRLRQVDSLALREARRAEAMQDRVGDASFQGGVVSAVVPAPDRFCRLEAG